MRPLSRQDSCWGARQRLIQRAMQRGGKELPLGGKKGRFSAALQKNNAAIPGHANQRLELSFVTQ